MKLTFLFYNVPNTVLNFYTCIASPLNPYCRFCMIHTFIRIIDKGERLLEFKKLS